MASKTLTFRVVADNGDALKNFGALAKSATSEMKKVEKALDDTRSAGKVLADSISADADAIAAELSGVRAASARLVDELGADWQENAADVDRFVTDLRRAGLSFEEIEADAESLAAAIKKLDDVRLSSIDGDLDRVKHGLDGVEDGARRVGAETDNSRSVLANFAGNAAAELPGVAGAFGPLNMAISQFTEYATEGNIAIKGLVGTMPLIAGGLFVVKGIADYFNDISESKAFNADQVNTWVDGLRTGQGIVQQIRDTALETGEILVRWGDMGSAHDLIPDLAKVNKTMGDFLALVDASPAQFDAWARAQTGMTLAQMEEIEHLTDHIDGIKGLTEEQKTYLVILRAAEQAHKNAAAATLEQSQETQVLFEAMQYTGAEIAATANAAEALAAGMYAVEAATVAAAQTFAPLDTLAPMFGATAVEAGKAATKIADIESALISLNDTVLAQVNAQFGLEHAWNQAGDQLAAYKKVLDDAKSSDEDKERATLALKESYLQVAEAAGRAAEEGLGPAATEADKAKAKNDAMRGSLGLLATTLEPGSQAYQAVMGWIALLGKIPMNLTTRIGATFVGNTPGASRTGAKGGFDDGGVVPGRRGEPVLVLAHGGETFVPTHKPGFAETFTGGGDTYQFVFNAPVADRATVIDWVHEGLLRKKRRSGALELV